MISRPALALSVTFCLLLITTGCNSTKKAIDSLNNGNYSTASNVYHNSADADEKKQIRKTAEEQLSSAVSDYDQGRISYEDVIEIVDELANSDIVSSEKIRSAKESINELRWIKQTYQTAEEYLNAEDYLSAMNFFSYIGPFNSLSDKAEEEYKRARSLYINKAEQTAADAAERQDYETALQILKVCTENIGTENEIEALMRKYETDKMNHAIRVLLESAKTAMDSGDYPTAYRMLVDGSNTYPGRIELETVLTKCKREYVAYSLQQAQTLFDTNKDYDGAISILSMAMIDLPGSPELQAAIGKYEAYRPVELCELTSLYEEHGGFGRYTIADTKDNYGNKYEAYYDCYSNSSSARDSRKTVYRIDGRYTRLSGVVFLVESVKNKENVGHVLIYGDGKLLFDSGLIGKGVAPVTFDIRIAGIAELTIECKSDMAQGPCLANIWLSNDIEN